MGDITICPAGRQVAANILIVRKARGYTTNALSERLGTLGRPILANGITKVEKFGRRVDVDDLVALAEALGVTVQLLLVPLAIGTEVTIREAT